MRSVIDASHLSQHSHNFNCIKVLNFKEIVKKYAGLRNQHKVVPIDYL